MRRFPAQFLAGPATREGEAESDARIHLMEHLNCRQIVSVSGNDDSLIEAPFTRLSQQGHRKGHVSTLLSPKASDDPAGSCPNLHLLLGNPTEDNGRSQASMGGKSAHIGPVALEPARISQIEMLWYGREIVN
jgi:hypothetical protein